MNELKMNSSVAARILSILHSSKRFNVSIPAADFKTIFFGLEPIRVSVDQVTKQPVTVLVNRTLAIKYLESKYDIRTLR